VALPTLPSPAAAAAAPAATPSPAATPQLQPQEPTPGDELHILLCLLFAAELVAGNGSLVVSCTAWRHAVPALQLLVLPMTGCQQLLHVSDVDVM
jgi:hypothetical protein